MSKSSVSAEDLADVVYLVVSGCRHSYALIGIGTKGTRTIARGFPDVSAVWNAVEAVSEIKRPAWPAIVKKV